MKIQTLIQDNILKRIDFNLSVDETFIFMRALDEFDDYTTQKEKDTGIAMLREWDKWINEIGEKELKTEI